MNASRESRIIVALDYPTASAALAFADSVSPALCRMKVGNELFTRAGPAVVEALRERGYDIFLDLKYHDIPNTVAAACRAAAELGVWLVNVHALGGPAMLQAAAEAVAAARHKPRLIGVTVLTSMDAAQLAAVSIRLSNGSMSGRRQQSIGLAPEVLALHLAGLCQENGLDGVVCSAQEAPQLRSQCGENFLLVTPGIRPLESPAQDQQRVVTPRDACQKGADYLVIGRPITQAKDPCRTLLTIIEDISDFL